MISGRLATDLLLPNIRQSISSVMNNFVSPDPAAGLGPPAPGSNPILNLSCPQDFGSVVYVNGVQYVRRDQQAPNQVCVHVVKLSRVIFIGRLGAKILALI